MIPAIGSLLCEEENDDLDDDDDDDPNDGKNDLEAFYSLFRFTDSDCDG